MNLEENLRRHAEAIEAFASVFVTEPKTIEDVAMLLKQLGEIHHRPDRAAELVAELRSEVASIPRRTFTFVCPIWKNPWMWCGGDTYVSHLVEAAGGQNLLGERTRYPQIELTNVLALNPDVVFLPDEPYLFTEAEALTQDGYTLAWTNTPEPDLHVGVSTPTVTNTNVPVEVRALPSWRTPIDDAECEIDVERPDDRHDIRNHLAFRHHRQRRQVHKTWTTEMYAIWFWSAIRLDINTQLTF
jgi:hypothetical protein